MERIETISALINAIPSPSLVIGQSERILAMNPAAVQMLSTQGVGRHYITVLRQPTLLDAIEGTLADHQPRETRFLGTGQTGETTYHMSVRSIGERSVPGILVSIVDISHAEAVGQMRQNFVANVSHELRTPLTALMGFIETLKGAAQNDANARTRFLDLMGFEADRMDRLVHDLLSLSRVESQERLRPGDSVDVSKVVKETCETFGRIGSRSGTRIVVDVPDAKVFVPGDRHQLEQVFSNLIENAIKYGGSGNVVVSLSLTDHDPALRGPSVIVAVTDSGDGIDPIHVPRLTERFYRVDSHRARAQGGTGLGLSIVKHIIGRHRGRLRIESKLGEGSTFMVFLPRL